MCVFFLPVCARVSEIEARTVPRGSGSRLTDSMADNRSSSGRLLGLVLSPAASSLSPLLAAPVSLSSQLNQLPPCHSPPATFFIFIFPFAHSPSFSSSSPACTVYRLAKGPGKGEIGRQPLVLSHVFLIILSFHSITPSFSFMQDLDSCPRGESCSSD